MDREGHRRGAVTALDAGRVDEGALHDRQLAALRKALDRANLAALGLDGEDLAGIDRLTVHEDGAEAAGALAVAAVADRDDALGAQRVAQTLPGSRSQATVLPLSLKEAFIAGLLFRRDRARRPPARRREARRP